LPTAGPLQASRERSESRAAAAGYTKLSTDLQRCLLVAVLRSILVQLVALEGGRLGTGHFVDEF